MMFSLTIENAYWWSQILSIILLAGTVLLGSIALFTGKILNDRQAIAFEEQREKTALAERSTLELQRLITEQRTLASAERMLMILGQRPKGTVSVLYVDNQEAMTFALLLFAAIRGTGWNVSIPAVKPPSSLANANLTLTGITLQFANCDNDPDGKPIWPEPGNSLRQALEVGVPAPFRPMLANGLQKDELVIVVGPKY